MSVVSKPERAFILLASDSAANAPALVAALRQAGHEVVHATKAADAVAELHGNEFDLAIVDLALPPRGGLELVRVAKQLSIDTEVVVLLGDESAGPLVECVRAGAVDFVRPPASSEELSAVVARSVERRRVRAQTAMFRTSYAVLAGTDPPRLVALLVELAAELLASDLVGIVRRCPAAEPGKEFYLAERSGDAHADAAAQLLALATEATRGAVDGAPILFPDDLPDADALRARFSRIQSALVCATVVDRQVTSIFAAARSADPRPFRRSDAERAGVIALQVRLALESAEILQQRLVGERLATVGALSASVAHELNNPIAYAIANSELALEELNILAITNPRLDGVREMLADVREGAHRIKEIARDLQSLSRSDEGVRIFDLNDAIHSALRIAAGRLRGSVRVTVDLAEHAMIEGSPGRLCQVFIDLFVNAARAAATCTRTVDLRVETHVAGGKVVARVSDTGLGMPAEQLARIFEPLFSANADDSVTSLGLAVTRSIVVAHGGRISAASTPRDGTTFVVEFPAAASPGERAPTAIAAAEARPRRRFLFIDDDSAVLRIYERWFGRDHDVVTMQSGRLALDFVARDANFDRIVCDVCMPGVSGKDVYRLLAGRDPAIAERFVFVTGGLADPSIREFVEATGRPVVEKPFTVAELRAALGEPALPPERQMTAPPASHSQRRGDVPPSSRRRNGH